MNLIILKEALELCKQSVNSTQELRTSYRAKAIESQIRSIGGAFYRSKQLRLNAFGEIGTFFQNEVLGAGTHFLYPAIQARNIPAVGIHLLA